MRFNGRYQIFNVSTLEGGNFSLSGLFFDETSTFTASDASPSNEIYDASGNRYIVASIESVSPFQVTVTNPDVNPQPSSGAASISDVVGPNSIPYPTRVSNGITEYLHSLIMERITSLLNNAAGSSETKVSFEDLGSQIDGINKVFTVAQGSYLPGKTSITSNGLTQAPGINYTESDPSTGKIEFATAPTDDDKPLLINYAI